MLGTGLSAAANPMHACFVHEQELILLIVATSFLDAWVLFTGSISLSVDLSLLTSYKVVCYWKGVRLLTFLDTITYYMSINKWRVLDRNDNVNKFFFWRRRLRSSICIQRRRATFVPATGGRGRHTVKMATWWFTLHTLRPFYITCHGYSNTWLLISIGFRNSKTFYN
jgi:hypothetical protein